MFAFAQKIVRILLYKFIKNWSSIYFIRQINWTLPLISKYSIKIILFQFWMNYRDIRHPFFLLNDIYMLLSIFNVMFWHCFLKTAPFNFCFRRICTLFIVHLFAVCYLHTIWKLIKKPFVIHFLCVMRKQYILLQGESLPYMLKQQSLDNGHITYAINKT